MKHLNHRVKILSEHKPVLHNSRQTNLCENEISSSAKEIIHKLIKANYQAYLVGGCVRDLLLGLKPKDFDIATNATPEQVKSVFKKQCRLIGRRFRLAHIYNNGNIYEVATFRGHDQTGELIVHQGQILRDNVYGNIEQDVIRRDFTCNALYYDIKNNTIIDYIGGVDDIYNKELKLIGKASNRFMEDPVRMLRCIRFSAKLGLKPSVECCTTIPKLAKTLLKIPPARLFDEIIKLFHCGKITIAFKKMRNKKLLEPLFPFLEKNLLDSREMTDFLEAAFTNTDKRIANNQSVTPIFLMACILWPQMIKHYRQLIKSKLKPYEALHQAANKTIEKQRTIIAIPKAIQTGIRQIWVMQLRFKRMHGKGVYTTLHHPRFRAAYDFLLLRSDIHQQLKEKSDFWTKIQELPPEAIRKMIYGKKVRHKKITPELM